MLLAWNLIEKVTKFIVDLSFFFSYKIPRDVRILFYEELSWCCCGIWKQIPQNCIKYWGPHDKHFIFIELCPFIVNYSSFYPLTLTKSHKKMQTKCSVYDSFEYFLYNKDLWLHIKSIPQIFSVYRVHVY